MSGIWYLCWGHLEALLPQGVVAGHLRLGSVDKQCLGHEVCAHVEKGYVGFPAIVRARLGKAGHTFRPVAAASRVNSAGVVIELVPRAGVRRHLADQGCDAALLDQQAVPGAAGLAGQAAGVVALPGILTAKNIP